MKIVTAALPKLDSFLPALSRRLATRHEVSHHTVTGDNQHDRSGLEADLIWCEFANEAVPYVHALCPTTPLIVRMHSYEAYNSALLEDIPWKKVHLVYTARHVLSAAGLRHPMVVGAATKTLIPSAVDPDEFPLRKGGDGFDVGMCCSIKPEKHLQDAIAIAGHLERPRFRITHVGDHAHQPARELIAHMKGRFGVTHAFRTRGPLPHDDVPKFWGDMNWCLSTSLREGLPYNVLEAMSTGCTPLVRCYPGAERQFEPRDLFDYIPEAARFLDEQPPAPREEVRARITDSAWNLHNQTDTLLRLAELAVEKGMR